MLTVLVNETAEQMFGTAVTLPPSFSTLHFVELVRISIVLNFLLGTTV